MRTTLLLTGFTLLLALASPPLAAQDAALETPLAPEAAPGGAADPVRDPSLYQADVSLVSQGESERRTATAQALGLVMVKVTGNPLAASDPVVRRAMGNAEAYLTGVNAGQPSTDQEANTAIGGVPVYKTVTTFSFDPGSIDALVAGAGMKTWGGDRPRPVLWLAIDDGRGARLVNSQQLNVVKPLATRGLERGLHFGLPAGGAIEQAAVQTVWEQNPAPMRALTARYGSETQLLGRVYRAGGGWTADWVLSSGEAELSRWSFSDPSPQRAIASGADGAADALARRDAVYVQVGEPGPLDIEVAGLLGAGDYTRVMGYLQTLPVVRGLAILEARPDRLELRLDLAVGPEAFAAFVAAGNTLQADPRGMDERPRFLLQP